MSAEKGSAFLLKVGDGIYPRHLTQSTAGSSILEHGRRQVAFLLQHDLCTLAVLAARAAGWGGTGVHLARPRPTGG